MGKRTPVELTIIIRSRYSGDEEIQRLCQFDDVICYRFISDLSRMRVAYACAERATVRKLLNIPSCF